MKRRPADNRRPRAFVLVVAMFVIAMLTAIVAQLSLTSGVAAVVALRQRDLLAARAAAHSVLHVVVDDRSGRLLAPPSDRPGNGADDEEPRLALRLGRADVVAYVRSEAGKINLNRTNAGGKGEQVAEAVRRMIQEHELPLPDPVPPDAPLIMSLQQLFAQSVDPPLLYGPRDHNEYLARFVTIGPPPGGGTSGVHSIYIIATCHRVTYRLLALVRRSGNGSVVLSAREVRRR